MRDPTFVVLLSPRKIDQTGPMTGHRVQYALNFLICEANVVEGPNL